MSKSGAPDGYEAPKSRSLTDILLLMGCRDSLLLNKDEIKLLIDYIGRLEQHRAAREVLITEVEELRKDRDGWKEAHDGWLESVELLRKDNERLRNRLNEYGNEIKDIVEHMYDSASFSRKGGKE